VERRAAVQRFEFGVQGSEVRIYLFPARSAYFENQSSDPKP
jgi:hypothetical protein